MRFSDEVSAEMSVIWMAAAVAGFANVKDWQKWADDKIERFENLPFWIFDLSTAGDLRQLWAVVREAVSEIRLQQTDVLELGTLVQGFYLIRYSLGQISLSELLKLAALQADTGFADSAPETFYSILNDMESGAITMEVGNSQVTKILSSACEIARSKWNEMVPDQLILCAVCRPVPSPVSTRESGPKKDE